MLTIETGKYSEIEVYELDQENEVRISINDTPTWLTIDQTKQLIEFLTKQIEGK